MGGSPANEIGTSGKLTDTGVPGKDKGGWESKSTIDRVVSSRKEASGFVVSQNLYYLDGPT